MTIYTIFIMLVGVYIGLKCGPVISEKIHDTKLGKKLKIKKLVFSDESEESKGSEIEIS